MNKFTQVVKDFWNDEEGLTLLEYILGASLIVAAAIGSGFWEILEGKFDQVGDCVGDPANCSTDAVTAADDA